MGDPSSIAGTVLTTPKDGSITASKLDPSAISGQSAQATVAETMKLLVENGGNLEYILRSNLFKQPICLAYRASSAQSIDTGTWTKIQLNTELVDSHGYFDHDASDGDVVDYGFQPDIAGWYLVGGQAYLYVLDDGDYGFVAIYKNGGAVGSSFSLCPANASEAVPLAITLAYLNGSTDYLELYGYHNQGGTQNINTGLANTFMFAVRISP